MKKCQVANCQKPHKSNGYCSAHYFRLRRHGSLDLPKTKRVLLLKEGKSYCPKCNQVKQIDEFNKDIHTFTGYAVYCKECSNLIGHSRYRKHKEKYQNYRLLKKFKITTGEYKSLFDAQNNSCAICQVPWDGKKFMPVDHDHKTGKIRGILCDDCNLGLGKFNDSHEMLLKAAHYLLTKKEIRDTVSL
jgi:hypothetical protein